MATATKTRPVHELRIGPVKAAIWANETKYGTRHNVTISRIYVGNDGKWQDSTTFGRDDLPLVAKVVSRAHDWIFEQAAAKNTNAETADAAV